MNINLLTIIIVPAVFTADCRRGFINIAATDMITALHEHSTIANLIGQSTIFALGIGFMQSIIVLEQFLVN